MIRIVIADDEQFIVQLICSLIDREALGVEVVGTASDGRGALEMTLEKKPDILITDIRMPCMDGIELIEHLRREGASTSVIAISGYKCFDYAYNAIKYGVEDFIVKPINKKELNASIQKTIERLQGKKETLLQIQDLERQASKNAEQLHGKLIEDSLKEVFSERTLEGINRAYMTKFVFGQFAGLSVKLDIAQGADVEGLILQKCKSILEQSFEGFAEEYAFAAFRQEEEILGIINTRTEQTKQLVRRIKQLFEKLSMELNAFGNIAITIGIGIIVSEPMQISESIRAAKASVRVKGILGPRRIYYSGALDRKNAEATLSAAQIDALRSILELRLPEKADAWLESVFAKPESYYREYPFEAMALVDSVMNNIFELCRMQDIVVRAEWRNRILRDLGRCASLPEIIRSICEFLVKVLKEDYLARVQRGNYAVECAKAYITRHLSEPLRLEEIAGEIMLSPSYLSNLFRKETGETISEYILRLRMEKAKRLLRTTNMNLSEIAANIGYADAKHFSKVFRKTTGAKPQEYRKMYSW